MFTTANRQSEIARGTLYSLPDPPSDEEDLKPQLENRPCARRGCTEPAAEDSEFCAPHEADQRRYNRDYDRRRRKKWEAEKRCMRCGNTKRAPKSRWCAGCLIRLDRLRRRVRADHKVQLENSNRWRPDPGKREGLLVNRFRGKGKQGRLSRQEQDNQRKRQILWAIVKLEEAAEGIDECWDSSITELPPIRRAAERRQRVGDPLGFAGRLIDELVSEEPGDDE